MNKKFWKNKKVFITGGTGLLGSWVTKYLAENDVDVFALVRKDVPPAFEKIFSKVTLIRGDIVDYSLIHQALETHKIDVVFHLAAQTYLPETFADPIPTFESNIEGSWIILEACRKSKNVKSVLFASSDKAYADKEKLPFTEKTPLGGNHPYNASKTCADLIAQSYFLSYSLPLCITRCGNFYGGGDLRLNRLIPSIIKAVLFNEPLVLRSDGKYTRDFFYVEDGALASIHLVEEMNRNPKILGEAFNFSNERPLEILEVVNVILHEMHSSIKPTILSISTGEVRNQYLSSEKARQMLNWEPKFSLEEGIKRTIDWYEEFFKKKRK